MELYFITVKVEAPTLEQATMAVGDAIDNYYERCCPPDIDFRAFWPHINPAEETPAYADLHGAPLEMELRRRVRAQMRAQNILDGVLEADIVSAILPLFPRWEV